MNSYTSFFLNLNRRIKLSLIILNDFLLALICWLVFGPPMATYIASEFSTGIFKICDSSIFFEKKFDNIKFALVL